MHRYYRDPEGEELVELTVFLVGTLNVGFEPCMMRCCSFIFLLWLHTDDWIIILIYCSKNSLFFIANNCWVNIPQFPSESKIYLLIGKKIVNTKSCYSTFRNKNIKNISQLPPEIKIYFFIGKKTSIFSTNTKTCYFTFRNKNIKKIGQSHV